MSSKPIERWRDKPAIGGFALFLAVGLAPLACGILYGGLYSIGVAGMLATGATLEPWRRVLTGGEFWESLAYSLYIAAAVISWGVAGALVLTFALGRRIRRGGLEYALLVPMALPGAVAGFFVYQMLSGSGLAVRLGLRAGLIETAAQLPALTNDGPGAGIVLAQLIMAIPFFTLLFVQIADAERLDELLSLARALGAGRLQGVLRVGVPIILRGAASNICLFFIVVMGSYEIPLLLGRQTPEMLSVLALRKYAMYDLAQKPEAFVVALLYTLATAGLVVAVSRRKGSRFGT